MSDGEIKRVKLRKSEGRWTEDVSLARDNQPHSSARAAEGMAGDGETLKLDDYDVSMEKYSCYFRPIDGYIDGWIINQYSPDDAITINVFVDDKLIATLTADLERRHLKKKFGVTSTAHGFRVLVPNQFRDGTRHSISLGVIGSTYRRVAREELQVPPSDSAPYLDVMAITERVIDGRIYGGDRQEPPELWIGPKALSLDEYSVEWRPDERGSRAFRIHLRGQTAEDLLIKSAQISVAHGRASGHAALLSRFVDPRIARVSAETLTVGSAIPFPELDRARCRLELSRSENFQEQLFSTSIDLSLGVNDAPIPAGLREGSFWARVLIVGGPNPIELLAPSLVPTHPEIGSSIAGGSAAWAEAGLIYAYDPSEGAASQGKLQSDDRNVSIASPGDNGPQAHLTVSSDGSGTRPYLQLTTDEATSDTHLRFAFSANGLQAGDLLHLRWIVRTRRLKPVGAPNSNIILSLSLGGTSSLKVWEEAIPPLSPWRDHHTILRLSAPGREMAIEFTAPAGCTLDVGGLAVGRIANAADTLAQATADISPVALSNVMSYSVEQPLPKITAANYGRYGFVGRVSSDGVSGIAWTSADVRRGTQLQLLVDGKMAGFASADPLDSFDKGGTPGFFSAPLPPAALDGWPHEIDVQFMGTRESLSGAPRALPANSRQDGAAWLTPAGEVAGWAADPDEGAGPVEVAIRVDGRAIARVLADGQHPMFSDSAHNNGRCAFSFPVPASIRDGRLHTINVQTTSGVELSGSPILATLKQSRSALHIDPSYTGWLKCWVATASPPTSTATVDISVNGEHFGTIRADLSHEVPFGERARFRFSFRLPNYASKVRLSSAALDVDEELVVVRVGDLNQISPARELRPTSSYSDAKEVFLAAPDQHVDAAWYFAMYPSAALETIDGIRYGAPEHWFKIGAKRGWSPSPWFDERWYLGRNPDAAAAVEAGEVEAGYFHWLAVGALEWRAPGPTFDPLRFRRAHPLAEDTGVEESAFDAVRAWLRELAERQRRGSLEAEAEQEVTPLEPGPSLLRRVMTSRSDKTTMYDTHVGRLLEDLRIAGYPDLDKLRRAFDDNEVQIAADVFAHDRRDEPLVSIIMPTFNRAYVIAEAIQSVIDQYWRNWELIICDDGSFDKTPKIVRQYSDPRIRYLQLEKANGAVARNFGIRFCRGEYVAFLDSDNIWHPLYLHLTINKLRSTLRPAVYTGYIDASSNGARYVDVSFKFSPFDYLSLVARNYIDLNSLVVQRTLLDQFGQFDETLPRVQDWDLLLRLLRFFDPVEVPWAAALYRRNPSWGQVTDLAAHTDYTKVVRQRALERLSIGVVPPPPLVQPVSLYAGDSLAALEMSLAFVRLLSGVTDVVLMLQDGAPQRSSVETFGVEDRVRTVWLHQADKIRNHVAGQILFVPAPYRGSALHDVPASLRLIEFAQDGTSLVIRDRRLPGDSGVALGALRISALLEAEMRHLSSEASRDRRRSAVVLTIAPMRQRWIRALSHSRDKFDTTLIWCDAGQYFSMKITGEPQRAETLSVDEAVRSVAHHSALLLAAGTAGNWLHATNFGIAAQQNGVILVTGKDDDYADWVNKKVAFLAPDDPEAAVDRLTKILDDQSAGQKMKARARRLFDYMYRPDVVDARLSTAISLFGGSGRA